MMTGPKDYAQRAANAFNQRDVQGLLALVDEDFVYLDGMTRQTGREAMRARELALFSAFPDAQVALTPFMVADDRLAMSAVLTGTFSSPLWLPAGVIVPAHGRRACLQYAAHFTFRNGLAVRETVFFDSATLRPSAEQGEG
ncbi:ester cyclase [Pseudomonas sp. SK]|uniref:ester cyclase n=1 Tax=Pseudomonas sp. SK TaxID=2729423 RepID=UPI001463D661|nr:nuclear transport factor 2 family protein [Pseudomonas sp. SK]QJQ19345.1 ester cyclase [Pseudomonas sp. SK]